MWQAALCNRWYTGGLKNGRLPLSEHKKNYISRRWGLNGIGMKKSFLIKNLIVFFFAGIATIGYTHAQTGVTNIQKKSLTMNANNQNELALAKNILSALMKNKPALWLALYPTNEEFKIVLQAMLDAQSSLLSKDKMDEML